MFFMPYKRNSYTLYYFISEGCNTRIKDSSDKRGYLPSADNEHLIYPLGCHS